MRITLGISDVLWMQAHMYELCAIVLLHYMHPRGCIIPSLLIEPSMQQAGLWLIPVASSNTFALLT